LGRKGILEIRKFEKKSFVNRGHFGETQNLKGQMNFGKIWNFKRSKILGNGKFKKTNRIFREVKFWGKREILNNEI
jgi:hypothetical protein